MDSRWLSESSTESRSNLLLKCKSAIENLTQDLDSEHRLRIQSDRKIKALSRDLTSLREEYERYKRRDETFGEEAAADSREQRKLRQKVNAMLEEIGHLNEEKEAGKLKYEAAMEELRTAQELLEDARKEVTEKQTAMEAWEELVKDVDAKLHSLSKDNDSLKLDRDKYLENCAKLLSQNEQLESLYQTAKQTSVDLTTKLEKLNEEHVQFVTEAERQKMKQHQSLTENFSQKTLEMHEEIREQRGKNEQILQENAKLVEETKKFENIIKELQNSLQAQKHEFFSMENSKKSLEIEISKCNLAIEALQNEHKKELEMREKLYSTAVTRVEEELHAHDQTRRRVEELSNKLTQNEQFYNSKITDYERRIEDFAVQLHRKNMENEDLRKKNSQLMHENAENITRQKSENIDIIKNLEAKIRDLEAQRIADHDQYQLEILRLKDDYTQALITSSEELKELRGERNRSRGTVMDLERRLEVLTEKMQVRSRGRREGSMEVLGQLREMTSRLSRAQGSVGREVRL